MAGRSNVKISQKDGNLIPLVKYPLDTVVDLTKITKHKEQRQEILDVLAYCKLKGFGGRCWAAAMAIRDILFHGEGTVVVASNEGLSETGLISGHAAVFYLGCYWDAEGAHPIEDIKEYGRLEVDDRQYAERYGEGWNEEVASTVRVSEYRDGIALWGTQRADYNEFSSALFAALQMKSHPLPAQDKKSKDPVYEGS